jgi:hypothetical protein
VAVAIVSGALANKPYNGGEAWVRLSWALGLERLGFETYFVEEISEDAGIPLAEARAHFESVAGDFGLAGRATLLRGKEAQVGLAPADLRAVASAADLLVNISGHLTSAELLRGPRRSVYVDLDPGFTQAWHRDRSVPFTISEHDHYVTVGTNLGTPSCSIPDCGIEWIATLPPVLLGEWPPAPVADGPLRLTTVTTWRSPYGPLEIDGRALGLKHHQFRRFIEMPERAPGQRFELALDIHPDDDGDLKALRRHGWTVVEPREVAGTPQRFRDYLAASGAEFSVAQEAYTATGSGWFSDRTAAYLACGRPALVQDTGLGRWLALGEGLLAFETPEEAVRAAAAIAEDRAGHGAAARAFAEAHLDSDVVLGRLLARIGVD